MRNGLQNCRKSDYIISPSKNITWIINVLNGHALQSLRPVLVSMYIYDSAHTTHEMDSNTQQALLKDDGQVLLGPILLTWFLIPAWISNHICHRVWVEIICPFPNFKGAAVVDWE